MVNEKMYELGSEPSAIRELFAYGLARKAEIGEDKVFDFSLGNPSIPAPAAVKEAIIELLDEPPVALHGYTPAQGTPGVRTAIADSINRRFGMNAAAANIYMTAGAAASLDISINAVANEGDEFIVIAPYFPEYRIWIEAAGCTCIEVMAREIDFQLDLAAIEAAVTPKTKGIIINSPNNPVGSVYSEENLRGLADVLCSKREELGSVIYVICDEPYREIVYEGVEVPYIPAIYDNTIVCYSYSKSLSLPGERIGYLYVPERMPDWQRVYAAICGAGRALGFVCAPSLFQGVIEKCVDAPTDVAAYAENRALLCRGLSELGYEYVEPRGAFYLWVKALEPDEQAFADRAKAHELLLVPSTSFGCSGYVRIGYCVDKATIEQSIPAFAALMAEYR
ncbi:pyridoxal phosphate-dependent aminotransferase [Raoultibacter timonensis]|uniref:Aminotransferase n=1 Tax=Raoultibacter timonensis TaxID=1907662 RepID=A0ABN6MI86_9ACTN|nr:pyridoxal phosphate-dependent aminotransferase [Raoultibacter timonensis]BDE97665.1 aminotransferase [Raoultibacter timonensis]BDF52268.1 aminotransferase [Raoultibacter timonensis]